MSGIPREIWDPVQLEEGETRAVSFGPLTLHLRREGDDLRGLFERDPARRESADCSPRFDAPPPEKGEWRRIGSVKESPELRIRPALPDRPVVVRPEVPYTILPGERVQFYVGVPLWVTVESSAGILLVSEPVARLSNTWFGTPMDGELCYAMRTMARRRADTLDFEPWRTVCPTRIRNQTKEALTFERICLRVQYLDLYQDARRGMWTNESGVTVKGDRNWSRISYARSAPSELDNPLKLVESRSDPRGGFSLRALTGGGGLFQ